MIAIARAPSSPSIRRRTLSSVQPASNSGLVRAYGTSRFAPARKIAVHATRASRTSKLQLSPACVNSASSISKRSSWAWGADHKFELGRRIDKPPDQPGGSNAIDMDTLARDPDSPGDIADPV